MEATLKPRDTHETCDAVQWAAAEERPLEIVGSRSKEALGRPVQTAHVLDLSGLSGVVAYEPEELVLTVKAGTPIADVEQLVASRGQELSFEPMDYGPLLGRPAGQGTVGGVLAANLSGPRRIKVGAARDHILGMEAVSGRGEVFNSGGKVVKNVTGYDLPRALCGSWGTLAVATTVTLKVNPAAETSATLIIEGLDDQRAVEAMCMAMGSSAEVSAAAHLPGGLDGERPRTLLRLEGFESSVNYRLESLGKTLAGFGKAADVGHEVTTNLWKDIRDCKPVASGAEPVWRLSVAPTAGAKLVAALRETFPLDAYYDWSGGLVWLKSLDGALWDGEIRQAVADCGGGHATLVRADASLRSSVSVFQPQATPLAALAKRLKQQFDPKGILNPGRMIAGT
ncbi:glycolate oxidase subunit GlcE [Roseibium polysiphoniae]|uniref:Glycolate oxidase subunit GlcE n=1 Tax=Roseibium polysiphoniae TaxID=2571221 RepID=A0A944GT19_9HYPH|nr:glycolate oxidase subunit GlcE [Roseibium polysiphoniae]MBS8261443.1 glycolate oxidase subunit GlcE [Roseibium polysiphoniae]